MKKVLFKISFQIVLAITFTVSLMAQGGDPPPFDPTTNDLVPLDGGLTMLLAAGVAYGAKKARDFRKK